MKTKLLFVAAAVVSLAACTSVPMASVSTGASGGATGGEHYCWKRNLTESDGKLYCNWVTDRSQACVRRDSTPVEMARFTPPAPSGRCETGEYLVKVLPR